MQHLPTNGCTARVACCFHFTIGMSIRIPQPFLAGVHLFILRACVYVFIRTTYILLYSIIGISGVAIRPVFRIGPHPIMTSCVWHCAVRLLYYMSEIHSVQLSTYGMLDQIGFVLVLVLFVLSVLLIYCLYSYTGINWIYFSLIVVRLVFVFMQELFILLFNTGTYWAIAA